MGKGRRTGLTRFRLISSRVAGGGHASEKVATRSGGGRRNRQVGMQEVALAGWAGTSLGDSHWVARRSGWASTAPSGCREQWVNRPLLTLRFPALSLWPRLRPNSQRPTGRCRVVRRCRVVNGSRLRFPKARWLELTFRQRSSVHEARTLSPLQASLETCGHIVAGREAQVCSDAGCIPHSLRLLGRPLLGLGSLFR